MAFGWFSGKKDPAGRSLEKADKLAGQGRWAEALSYYEDALEAQPGWEPAAGGVRTCRERLVAWNLEEAQGYANAEDLPKAQEHAALALELAGEHPELRRRAQEALDRLGSGAPEAPAPGRAAERLFPPSCACPAPSCATGGQGETDEDLASVDDLFGFYLESLSAEEREAFEHLGDGFAEAFVHLQQGETDRARPGLEEAARAHPDAPGPHYALGLLAALDKEVEAAEGHFLRALGADPDFSPAAHHRADVLRERGRPGEGAAFLREWLKGHPEDGEAWVLLAAGSFEAGDPAPALEAAEEAVRRVGPADPRPTLWKARALRELRRPDEALEAFQTVAARHRDLLEALVPLGQLLLEKGAGTAEKAAEVFKRCYRLDGDRGWWYLLRVAEAYAAKGWKPEARDVLATARRELPDTEEALAQWDVVSRRVT
ncbi:MAG: tetratricopeptide repeat protein [Deferrisomatales bacterium]